MCFWFAVPESKGFRTTQVCRITGEMAIFRQSCTLQCARAHAGVKMVTERAKRSRALDVVLELGIAVGIVGLLLVVAFFYATHQDANWMPSPYSLKQGAWIVGVTGLGVVYTYLAYSTRSLQRSMADKKYLQPLMALPEKWYMNAAIAAACFIAALALLWRMVSEHARVNASAAVQVLLGAVIFLGGLQMVRVGAMLRSHSVGQKFLAHSLTAYVLPIGLILYGTIRLVSGIYLFLK